MGEYFDADAIVATILGWGFSIPTGILKMATQLQKLPGVLYLYTPMQKFWDPRFAINIFVIMFAYKSLVPMKYP